MADTSKQIKDLVEATSVNDDDLILIQANDDNCRKVTKETLLREINQDKTTILNDLGDKTQLTTTDKTSIVNAINENTSHLNANVYKPMSATMYKLVKTTTTKKIKLIGDSITAGLGGTGYSLDGEVIYGTNKVNENGHCWSNSLKTYLQTNFNCTVKNFGIGGTNSSDVVAHLSDLIKSDDDIIICMIGTNNRDLADGINVLINDLQTIYNYVKNLGKEIIFISSIPSTDETYTYKMKDVDNAVMYVATKNNLKYISLYKLFIDYYESRGLGIENLLYDCTHPNDTGYDVLFYLVINSLGFGTQQSIPQAQREIMLTSGYNLNSITTSGVRYYTDRNDTATTILNKPTNVTTSFSVEYFRTTTTTGAYQYGVQILIDLQGNIYKRYMNANVWQSWQEASTDTGWISLSMNGSVTNYDNCKYRKTNKLVSIEGRVSNISANSTTIATLPVGFRPSTTHFFMGYKDSCVPVGLQITTSGAIILLMPSSGSMSASDYVTIATSFSID